MGDLAAPDQNPELVYVWIANDISARITSGELPSGTRLRAERELAAYYEVAYATIRRATALLRDRGLIRTVHGRGTFVI